MEENCRIETREEIKFCKHCGERIAADAVICTKCGRQVEQLESAGGQPSVVINNTNQNSNVNQNTVNVGAGRMGRQKRKWVAFFLCLFLGLLGAHKFYEGKIGMGILYLLTGGVFFIGWIIDLIALLGKPDPYFV